MFLREPKWFLWHCSKNPFRYLYFQECLPHIKRPFSLTGISKISVLGNYTCLCESPRLNNDDDNLRVAHMCQPIRTHGGVFLPVSHFTLHAAVCLLYQPRTILLSYCTVYEYMKYSLAILSGCFAPGVCE